MAHTHGAGPPQLLVAQLDEHCPLHEMDGWLKDEGLTLHQVRPFQGDPVPGHVDAEGLVVLGGDMSSLDDDKYPWLEFIRALQRDADDRGLPSLGVCLGGQLMAQAFGGRTAVGDNGLEAGVAEIEWLPDVDDDPVFAGLPSPFTAALLHRDVVSALPPNSTLLGTGSVYRHQAFRVGGTSWGVQFHPEINSAVYEGWTVVVDDAAPLARQRIEQGSVDFMRRESAVLKDNRELVRNFAAVVRSAASARRGVS